MKKLVYLLLVTVLLVGMTATSCSSNDTANDKHSIVVTYSVLGSLVKELVGDNANVIVSVPDGLDPHEWEPSAKDIENLNKADLIVQNGLEFETGMQKAIANAVAGGVKIFTASDYITVRHVGEGEIAEDEHEHEANEEHEDEDGHEHQHEAGSADPHLWTNPLSMLSIIQALAPVLNDELGLDVSASAAGLSSRLVMLDGEIKEDVSHLPASERKLVTGHESMGYFAERYGFQLIGAIIPSISTQAEVSAADLAELKQLIEEYQVPAIFTELGTNPAVAKAIGDETGVKVVEITSHMLPEDGSYFTMMKSLATAIVNALE